MPEGHRVFAARSVLDGREHDGSIDRTGRNRSPSTSTHLQPPASETPSERYASQVKRSSAICVRVFTAANNFQLLRERNRFPVTIQANRTWNPTGEFATR